MRKLCLIAFGVVSMGDGADIVKLRNGVRLEVERTEREADGVWLYTTNGIQLVAMRDISSIEKVLPPGTVQPPPVAPKLEFRPSNQSNPTRKMIDEAAWRHGLPPAIVHAVAQAESAYNQKAVSPVGAIGVMQLMPYTAAALGANPRNEAENIDAGTRYLRDMLVKFQHHPDQVAMALAAYNAGPGAVERYRGVPPYSETQTYVRRVIGKYEKMATTVSDVAASPEVPRMVAPMMESVAVVVPQVDRPTVVGLN
jgi:soluble lytic murein transglycosylase-like protein